MIHHIQITDQDLRKRIRRKEICFGGNRKLRIYGMLDCTSGKRMKRENRVFFISEGEAEEKGFRPCGKCMKSEYKKWKNGFVQ